MTKLSRRTLIGGLAAAPVATAAGSALAEEATAAAAQPPGVCTLLPQAVEGPYYFDPRLVRSDITEGRPGLAMQLKLQVIENGPCTPIANARIDVWHADAGGVYSGYANQGDNRDTSTKEQAYLRGTQLTDGDGNASFKTVFPGWYPGRTPHIHVKVFLDEKTLLTGQIYFPTALSTRIYSTHPSYSTRPVADTTNDNDGIFRDGGKDGGGTVVTIDEQPELIVAALRVGVDRSGKAASGGFLDWLLGRG